MPDVLASMVDRPLGPVPGRIVPEQVAAYIEVTGDDASMWDRYAPPSYAGALLFAIAPVFLGDPGIADETAVLVHVDQDFTWHAPLTIGAEIALEATVRRVRRRGTVVFVAFEAGVTSGGRTLLTSTSTFLMGAEPASPATGPAGEPAVRSGSASPPTPHVAVGGVDDTIAPVRFSASRLDLVRYAAASGDYNPIHFDHESARTAGLDGVVVHGLLMAAWLARLAAARGSGPQPLRSMRFRFRNALRPAVAAVASGRVTAFGAGGPQLALTLAADDTDLVTATATVMANEVT